MRLAKPPSLDAFYAAISRRLRGHGVPCAITGGLACVEFGVAEHTEDCDLICPAAHADTLLNAAILRYLPETTSHFKNLTRIR